MSPAPTPLLPAIAVRRVAPSRILFWLRQGWSDMVTNPVASIAYGLLFAIAGDIILLLSLPYPHLFSLAVSGFFLIAPLLAAGLYEISRRKERHASTTFIESLEGWRRNLQSLALFGLCLAIVGIVWERCSAILFALLYQGSGAVGMGIADFIRQVVISGEHPGFVAAWFILGGMIALLVFALSAISVPMMQDRSNDHGGDLVSALQTSVRAVLLNPDVMLLWAAIITLLTLLGFASFLFGLIVLMPLLGHATWHAYRDLTTHDH